MTPTSRFVRLGLAQMRMSGNPAENLATASAAVAELIRGGADVICLPELFLSYYFGQSEDEQWFDLAEPVPGPTTDHLVKLIKGHKVTLLASLFEERAPGLYHNTLAVLDGIDGFLGKYRKMHIPDDPQFMEKYYFTPGDLGYQCYESRKAKLGTLVCWDQWYPEAARLTALKGAEILFYPTAIGWRPGEAESVGEDQRQSWITIQRSHAIANGCFVVAVNRTGEEPHPEQPNNWLNFWGSSFIANPDGKVIWEASKNEPENAIVEIDLAAVTARRRAWPHFRDRRIETYQDLSQRFGY
jgi:N-carbamoylputrescine amidase